MQAKSGVNGWTGSNGYGPHNSDNVISYAKDRETKSQDV